MMRLPGLPLLAVLATGCVIGGDKYQRPSELPDVWFVDRLRILGVQPEPPEVRPGEPVSFSALVADPFDEADLTVWLACGAEASGAGCELDFEALSDDPTAEELEAAGVIGIEPGFAPVYVPPADILDALAPEERLEGLTVTAQLAVFPAEALEGAEGADVYNQVEVGYKRLVVSEAATPNDNPFFGAFTVDGVPIAEGATVFVDAGEEYALGVDIPPEAIQTYTYVTRDGTVEADRVEEPYVTWYVTAGTLGEYWTIHPFTVASWRAPETPGEALVYAVVRDRRGGLAWHVQPLTIR